MKIKQIKPKITLPKTKLITTLLEATVGDLIISEYSNGITVKNAYSGGYNKVCVDKNKIEGLIEILQAYLETLE